jgi:hypothetical protein
MIVTSCHDSGARLMGEMERQRDECRMKEGTIALTEPLRGLPISYLVLRFHQ